jgi:hypothetical protein
LQEKVERILKRSTIRVEKEPMGASAGKVKTVDCR